MLITKAQAAGGGGLAVVGAGGTAAGTVLVKNGNYSKGTTPRVMDFIKDTPKFVVLAMDDDFVSNYGNETGSNGKIGKKYGWYLTSIYDEDSKKWWEKSYEKWQSDNNETDTYDHFKKSNIKSAFADKNAGTSNGKALNQVCEEIAKGVIGTYGYNDADMFKYCSPMERAPADINSSGENSTYTTNGIIAKNSNLISVNNSNNDIFWELRNYEFFGKDNENGLGANLTSDKDSLFGNLYSTKTKNRGKIKNVCAQVYKLSGNGEDDLFVKLCGW